MSDKNKTSIYCCPHCNEKTFDPWTKAFAGQLNSYGKPCKSCGRLCVNGRAATIFNAVFSLICFVAIVAIYIIGIDYGTPIIFGLLLLLIFFPKIVNAFFFRLEKAIKRNLS